MSNYNFNYAFNISGNCNAVVAEISGGVENLQRNLRATTSLWDTFEGKILALNQFTQYVGNLSQTLNETLAPGAALNAIGIITDFIKGIESVLKPDSELFTNISTVKNLTINFAPKEIGFFNDENNIAKQIHFEKHIGKLDQNAGRQPHTISRLRFKNAQGVESAEIENASRETEYSIFPLNRHHRSFSINPLRVEREERERKIREAIVPQNPNFFTIQQLWQNRLNEINKISESSGARISKVFSFGKLLRIPNVYDYETNRDLLAGNNIVDDSHISNEVTIKSNSGILAAISAIRPDANLGKRNVGECKEEKIKREIRLPFYGIRSYVRFETLGLREIGAASLRISREAQSSREERYESERRATIQVEKMIGTVVINHNGNESSDNDIRIKESLERILSRCVEDISADFFDG